MISAGDVLESIKMMDLSRDGFRLYAEASLDHNPIHLDDEVAQRQGLKSVIAHGMLIAGLLAQRAQSFGRDKLDSSWRVTNFKCRFKNMSFPGESIISVGNVVAVEDGKIEISLKAQNQDGEVKTSSTVVFGK